MKYSIYIITFLSIITSVAFAQQPIVDQTSAKDTLDHPMNQDQEGLSEPPAEPGDEIYTVVEEFPSFPGGQAAMHKFLTDKITYTGHNVDREEEGMVLISFIIEKDGSLTEITLSRSSGYKRLDEEALKAVKLMPAWNPGKVHGYPVRCKMRIPVRFKLSE